MTATVPTAEEHAALEARVGALEAATPPTPPTPTPDDDAARWGVLGTLSSKLMVFTGSHKTFHTVEEELGRPVRWRLTYVPHDTWSSLHGTVRSELAADAHDLELSIPLALDAGNKATAILPTDAELPAYVDGWEQVGRLVAADQLAKGDRLIIIRPGWELGGSWYKWSIRRTTSKGTNTPQRYAEVWRTCHGAFYAGLEEAGGDPTRVRFAWGTHICSGTVADNELAWPGDEFADIVEVDCYDGWHGWENKGGYETTPSAAAVVRANKLGGMGGKVIGLRWAIDFAAAHNKWFGVAETANWLEPEGHDNVAGRDNPEWWPGWEELLTPDVPLVVFGLFDNDNDANDLHEWQHFPDSWEVFVGIFGAAVVDDQRTGGRGVVERDRWED